MTCSIFIDSMTSRGSCNWTVSPAATCRATIVPCIGASMRTVVSATDVFYNPSAQAEHVLREHDGGENADDHDDHGGDDPQHGPVHGVTEHRSTVGEDQHEREDHWGHQPVQDLGVDEQVDEVARSQCHQRAD